MSKFTYEERVELTNQIAYYIIETKSSTRNTAMKFKISNATISVLMNDLLKILNREKFLLVQEVLNMNKPKSYKDEDVRKRVLLVADMVLNGFTVEEISKSMNETVNVINEDLQTRLKKISPELYINVKLKLKENSYTNLQIGRNMTVENQERDINGRFK